MRTSDFFNIRQNRDWLRGLPLKTVPTWYRRTWQCCSLKILSEPERLGLANIAEITLRYNTDSVIFVTFCQKVKWDIITNDQSATAKKMRKQLWATNTWPTDPTPDPWPRLPPRWSLFLHYLSCKAGVGAPPVSRFLAYMSEKKNLERSPNPSYEFF